MTTKHFPGACDASAASRIHGTTLFVAASDEDYLLRIFDWEAPGAPVSVLDVSSFLEPIKAKKEPDIEGSAQVANRVYWITSHGRDKDAVEQESRQRLFATEIAVTAGRAELRPVGRPYKDLLNDLVNAPDLADCGLAAGALLAPEAEGGLSIEGLTSTAEGHLLMGFRNPIPHGKALLVRLHNPIEVAGGEQPAKVTKEALLDLGNRGIRAIEPIGDGRYLILAGRFDDTRDFALFRWRGAGNAVEQLLDGTALNALNPEELLLVSPTAGAVHLVSDDGDLVVDGVKCKKRPESERSFRITALEAPGG